MNWTTIYITGKPGFHDEVLRQLESSDFSFMPGSSDQPDLALFWIDEKENLRNLKMAIGSKTVFKYRLQFFNSVQEFDQRKQTRSIGFTSEEHAMIIKMSAWERTRNKLKKLSA